MITQSQGQQFFKRHDHYRERHNEKEQQTKKSSKKSKSLGYESDKIKFKGSPKINFKTIKHQPDLLRLHIEEAIAIKQLKPTLNRRQETLGMGFLPYFFPSLFARFLSIYLYIFIILTFTCTLHTSLLLTLPLILHRTSSALSLAQFFLTILAQFPPIRFQHRSHSCTSYKWRTHTTLISNLLFLSWLLTDDGVEHRNVFKSNYQLLPPDLSYHQ